MALLGDDGRGYELARKLESQGVWRSWLGEDSLYATFVPYLASPASWESFVRTDDNKSRALIQLQLRVRALLFDKACISLFPRPNQSSSSSNSKLNPNYLELHGDDIYYTLENPTQNAGTSMAHSKASSGGVPRFDELEDENMSQRSRPDVFPDSWYTKFFEKYRANKPYRLPSGDRESENRTPEQMSNYLRIAERHKRSRTVFKEELGSPMFESGSARRPNSDLDNSNVFDDQAPFFPETMFSANCVPDSALPLSLRVENNQKIEFNGVLDNLPQIMTKSPIMIERLGIRPEYLSMEQQGNQNRGRVGPVGKKNTLTQQQASELSRKVVAQLLMNVGFDSASEIPLDILSQLLSRHISKLGSTLKLLSDSYRKECSALELIKMFLQTIGHGNLSALSELVKDNTKNNVQQTQQVQAIQSQMQLQHQTSVRQSHQVPRQMVHPLQQQQMQQMVHPLQQQQIQQMQQMVHPLQQQQWDRMRRRQPSTARSVMNIDANMNVDKEGQRPMMEVKLENPPDFAMDNNAAFATMNARNSQLQFRQQQLAAALHAQSSNQLRQLASVQVPQLQQQVQQPNVSMIRAPPVKVEGFQELMGGDSSMKHDSEENKLASPK